MEMTIYTDGSCNPNPGPGAWAFVVYEDGREVFNDAGAERDTTNNRMEIQSVLRALQWLDCRPARVLSDSQYVVQGLNDWAPGWARRGWTRKPKNGVAQPVLNVDLWQAMVAARKPGQTLEWVRGHAGNVGNERADFLAEKAHRAASARPVAPAVTYRPVPRALTLHDAPESITIVPTSRPIPAHQIDWIGLF